jgi:hypothetical protein
MEKESPYFENFTRPRSFAIYAENDDMTKQIMESLLVKTGLEDTIAGVQTIKKNRHWIITCKSPEEADTLARCLEGNKILVPKPLRENRNQIAKLHSIPMEYSNGNIEMALEPYFGDVQVKHYKHPDDVFPTNIRMLRYRRVVQIPPRRIKIASGMYGYLTGNLQGPLECAELKCGNCARVGHISEVCKNKMQCGKCTRYNHTEIDCRWNICFTCDQPIHRGEECRVQCALCREGHLAKRCPKARGKWCKECQYKHQGPCASNDEKMFCERCRSIHAEGQCPLESFAQEAPGESLLAQQKPGGNTRETGHMQVESQKVYGEVNSKENETQDVRPRVIPEKKTQEYDDNEFEKVMSSVEDLVRRETGKEKEASSR